MPNPQLTRRAVLTATATTVAAATIATTIPAAATERPFLGTGWKKGLVVTDLEVTTVTPTSITFNWATYNGPHSAYGPLAPTVPTDSQVRIARADEPFDRAAVYYDPTSVGFHLVTVDGLEPDTEYRFECSSAGIVAQPGLITTASPGTPEATGLVRTLSQPAGEYVTSIAIVNDTHIGEAAHGLIIGDFPPAIVQAEGLPPYPSLMLQGCLSEIADRAVWPVFVNGDCTSEARPAECQHFFDLMSTYGEYGVDWYVTRGNHDRPHTPMRIPMPGMSTIRCLRELPIIVTRGVRCLFPASTCGSPTSARCVLLAWIAPNLMPPVGSLPTLNSPRWKRSCVRTRGGRR
ncbi:fibronectin type III domain-containing protein [Corynebacterium sp. TAE3-ERU12]|nr:fibronectin type III domain-containing protein [Corynebacterium sp. TAE3-ERU12]